MQIHELVLAQREFFQTGKTKPEAFRRAALETLGMQMKRHEADIYDALKADLNKSEAESFMTEFGMVESELRFLQKHLHGWMREKRVRTPMMHFLSRSRVLAEPYGMALILSPWNYPFQLCVCPVLGALGAGNCAVVKPSEYAPETARAVEKILSDGFPQEYVAVVQGDQEVCGSLLEERFDSIFFTGSVEVGRLVMERAARHLTPVTLELGGKSPCIVDATANLPVAAKRIVFGKLLNAGQTCVAPDYLLVQESIKEKLIAFIRETITEFYGENPLECPDYPKIINERHFQRLTGLMEGQRVRFGGETREGRWIAPALLEPVSPEAPVMREEIFGPILPVLSFREIPEAIAFINAREKPLALYLFTTDRAAERAVLAGCSFGGGCVNDTITHLATPYLPFGGVGCSGMGSYHGYQSFAAFTHKKSIIKKANWPDIMLRYPPYRPQKLETVKKALK